MQPVPVLVGYRPVVHLATGTVLGWRLGRTRTPDDHLALDDHLRTAVRQMADTLQVTDGGRRSRRFAVIEARIDEAPLLVSHLEQLLVERGLPADRFAVLFPGAEVIARADLHDHLWHLIGLGAGVAFDDPGLDLSATAVNAALPITRLRLRLPLDGGEVDMRQAEQFSQIVNLAQRHGILITATEIDTADQQSLARRAGVDVGTGDYLAPLCEHPTLDIGMPCDRIAVVQRLSHVVHGTRDQPWAAAGA